MTPADPDQFGPREWSFLDQHLSHIYRFARRLCRDEHTAEDLAQEAMLRAWKNRERFSDETATRTWMLRTVHNLWRDEMRKQLVRRQHAPNVHHERSFAAERRDRSAEERHDQNRVVLACLDDLPLRQREVLYLAACEQLSVSQIATVLTLSREAVKSSLSLARRRFRERLTVRATESTGTVTP